VASVWYCTREDVKGALDSKTTARNNQQIDRAVAAASRAIEGLTHRRFYPWTGTRRLDWPDFSYARPWRLWLDSNEVISVTTFVTGDATLDPGDYILRRSDGLDEPPYTMIEIDLSSSAAFNVGTTAQRSMALTGVFGAAADEESVGALAQSLAASVSATANITWTTPRFGVGDILRIDDERVIITNRTMVDSTMDLLGSLTSAMNDVSLSVTDGTAFAPDEVLLLDSERMLVVDIAGNTLTVRRAWDGSVLAAHSGSSIYTLTGVEIARGQLGTAIAAHASDAAIYRHVVPPLVRDLAVAEAMNTLLQEVSGYAREVGSGDNTREASGRGLKALREDVYTAHGRKVRMGAI
jgi:hypothetical protein